LKTGEGKTDLSTEEKKVTWADYEAASKTEEEAVVVLKV